ncbi:MAG: metallophosphoesterase family protein [Rubripirellula sp.]
MNDSIRRFAIGDIHGCAKALRGLIEEIAPRPQDEVIFMGDYVDRGPNSKDVVDQIIDLQNRCNVIALRGNHEIMLMGVALAGMDDKVWQANGGRATVTSYGGSLAKIPAAHLAFFQELLPYYETPSEIFVHANYHPLLDMHQQIDMTTYWEHLTERPPLAHKSGKRVFVGHTPQPTGNVLDVGHLVCLDTYCFGGRYLTAFNLGTDEILQADFHGHLRRPSLLTFNGPLGILWTKTMAYFKGRIERTRTPAPETAECAAPASPVSTD